MVASVVICAGEGRTAAAARRPHDVAAAPGLRGHRMVEACPVEADVVCRRGQQP
jgi:hypothetical protein